MPNHTLTLLRRALSYVAPNRGLVVVIIAATLLTAATAAIEPMVMKFIFDGIVRPTGALRALTIGVALLLGLALIRELGGALANWLTWRIRLAVHYVLLQETVDRLHRMPLSMQREEGVGAILTRLERSIQGLLAALTRVLFEILPALLYLVIAVILMVRLDLALALVVLAFTPLPAILAAIASPEQVARERSLLERWAKIYSRFNEVLAGLVTVRSFSMEDREKQRFLENVDQANRLVVRGVRIDSTFTAAANLSTMLARVAAIGYGGWRVVQGDMSVGTVVAFLGFVGGLFAPVQGLTGIFQTFRRATVFLEQIFGILDQQDQLGDDPDAVDLDPVQGRVAFRDVKFSYEQAGRPILDGVDLEVPPGQRIAIVGPSGSGKSTLMALLMRFYDPSQGAVLLDGIDLRRIRQKSLRQNIATVLQDPVLFNESVLANICYGRPGASLEEAREAARVANAAEFIERLPEAYDTRLGERGSRLSLGERQRIAIARAVLKDPPIFILDEATASLDAESESLVQEALDRLMAGRTTFIIAHRLTTVANADRIVVLRDGRIVEDGNHAQLMAENGYYAFLVDRQTRGLLPDRPEAARKQV